MIEIEGAKKKKSAKPEEKIEVATYDSIKGRLNSMVEPYAKSIACLRDLEIMDLARTPF